VHWDSDIGAAGNVVLGLWAELVSTGDLFFQGVLDIVSYLRVAPGVLIGTHEGTTTLVMGSALLGVHKKTLKSGLSDTFNRPLLYSAFLGYLNQLEQPSDKNFAILVLVPLEKIMP